MRRWNRAIQVASVVVAGVLGWGLVHSPRAEAQIKIGEFALFQSGGGTPVGWAVTNADRTVEWWAYIDGTYEWADSSRTPMNPWALEAAYMGSSGWGSFDAWKADVLGRSAASGMRIIFQVHAVEETVVDN